MPTGYAKSGKAPNQKPPIPKKWGKKRILPPEDKGIKKIPMVKPADMSLAKDIPSERGTMTLNDYQHAIKEFIKYPDKFTITYPALGLASEAGEVAGKIKKVIRDHKDVNFAALPHDVMPELGDCLWYIAALGYNLGLTLEEIAQYNIEKLRGRKERGTLGGSGDVR